MKQSRLAFVLGCFALAACGGKGSGAKAPVASIDPCTAGLHASGVTGRATSWELVASMASAEPDGMCDASPCSADAPVSFVSGESPVIAVKNDDGWTVIGNVWDPDAPQPEATVTALGDLKWLHVYAEELGREEVTMDDGSEQTATVIAGQTYLDFVLDGSGKVLFRAVCGGEGDDHRATVIARDGDAFTYVRCDGDATPVRFTAEQASACPSVDEGGR